MSNINLYINNSVRRLTMDDSLINYITTPIFIKHYDNIKGIIDNYISTFPIFKI